MEPKNSSSFSSTTLTNKSKLIWCVLYIIESVVIIAFNTIAFKIFAKKKFLIVKSSYLILNMTFADVLVGVSQGLIGISTLFLNARNWAICSHPLVIQLCFLSGRFIAFVSLLSMAMLAIERVMSVFRPIKHRKMTVKPYYIGILMSWGLSIYTFSQVVGCTMNVFYKSCLIYMKSLAVVTILTIICSYSAIVIKMLYLPKNISSFQLKMNMKLSKTLLLTTVVALVNWGPSFVIMDLNGRGLVSDDIATGMLMLITANSLANLVVYTIRMPHFRREMQKVFKTKKKIVNPIPINEMARTTRHENKAE